MSELTDRGRAAVHEAAHVIVSTSLGLRPQSAVVIGDGPEVHGRMFSGTGSDPISAAAVLLAGYVADLALGFDEGRARARAATDLEEMDRLAAASDLPSELMSRAEARARGIVGARWDAIVALAERLDSRLWGLRGLELDEALEAASGSTLAPDRLEHAVYSGGAAFAARAVGYRARLRRCSDYPSLTRALARRGGWRDRMASLGR